MITRTPRMRLSSSGASHIMSSEGLRLSSYQDSVGVWTVGWGHTGPDVKPGMSITRGQAEALFMKDIQRFETGVSNLVKVPISQNQFDALVSFAFNVGTGNLAKSTLLKKLNAGDVEGAAAEFSKWKKAGGVTLAGLVKRREDERRMFLGLRPEAPSGMSMAATREGQVLPDAKPSDGNFDKLLSENQRISSELASLVRGINEEAADEQDYLDKLRREGRGQIS